MLLVVVALGSIACFGARPYQPVRGDPLLEPWRWRTFPELSGLGIQCMAEGANAAIWFGSSEGVWRYNGFDWTLHSNAEIKVTNVIGICRRLDGSVLVAGRTGISQFRDGAWSKIFPFTGTPFGDIRKLLRGPDDSLWVATAWGALHQLQSKWTLHTDAATAARVRQDERLAALEIELLPEALVARSRPGSLPAKRSDLAEIAADQAGRIWLGTVGGEVLCHVPAPAPPATGPATARGVWSLYNESDGLVCGTGPSILALQDGSVWVAHAAISGQLNAFAGGIWRTIRFADAGVARDVGQLLQTRDGAVWLSGQYAVSAYREGRWRTYEKPEVPIPSARNYILQSSDGALWIAGPGTEIQRVDYETPRWLTLQDLNFQWESPEGAQWFLHRDGRVVLHEKNRWTSFGAEDGAIDAPVALVGARDGSVWAAGSHQKTAATSRFDGRQWERHLHENLSWGVDWRGAFAASDGSVWFGAAVDSSNPKNQVAGLLQFRDGKWTHHHQPNKTSPGSGIENPAELLPPTQRPEPIGKFLSLGESRDGRIWTGRNIAAYLEDRKWNIHTPRPEFRLGVIEAIFTTRERDLWIGSRQFGALRYDGRGWQRFQGKDSLVANSVRSLAETADGSIWAGTDRGVSRFDGRTWTADLLPTQLSVPHEAGSLKASPSGALWINRFTPAWNRRAWPKSPPLPPTGGEFWTVAHRFDGTPPETVITAGAERVAPPGNLSVLWRGTAAWREVGDSELQYSFRLDGAPWSDFTAERGHAFFTLPGGRHRFEVRARNRDFIVDPTPATLDFVVLPPVWRQAWFIVLIVALTGSVAAQSIRVFLERARLRKTNRELAGEIEAREQTEEALRRLNLELDQRVHERTAQLATTNRELESFSYSVSHDLRTPLRSIDGFSRILLEDYSAKLDDEGRDSLRRVRAASQRMGRLIDDLMQLSRTTRAELRRAPLDLTALAQEIAADLSRAEPERGVEWSIAAGLTAQADAALLGVVLQNLLSNAWKFTGRQPHARIELGMTRLAGEPAFHVRDNGAGFEMDYAGRLFGPFQRLHTTDEFPGTGIGLATVQRIIHRHGGRVWAEGHVDRGATFFFTLPEPPKEPPS